MKPTKIWSFDDDAGSAKQTRTRKAKFSMSSIRISVCVRLTRGSWIFVGLQVFMDGLLGGVRSGQNSPEISFYFI